MAIDPLGDVLYVANTNFDRSFGGATLLAVDVERHERAVKCFRSYGADTFDSDGNPVPAAGDAECGMISCADSGYSLGRDATVEATDLQESGYHAPAHFDRCYCQRDVFDPNVVNCEPQRFIVPGQTTKVGSFPADLQLLAEDPPNWDAAFTDSQTLHRSLYLAVRGDPSVTFMRVERPLPTTPTSLTAPKVNIDCGGRSKDEGLRELRGCAAWHRIQRTPDDIYIDPNRPEEGTIPRFEVPTEPSGLTVDRGCVQPGQVHQRGTAYPLGTQNPPPGAADCFQLDANNNRVKVACPPCYHLDGGGNAVADPFYQYLVATHAANGYVSAFDLGQNPLVPTPPVLQDVSVRLLQNPDNRRGALAFSVAPRRRGDLSQPWYVTSQVSGQLSTFRLGAAAGPKVVPGLLFSLSNQLSYPQDVRDVVFEPSGDRAYVALFSPPTLAVLDTSQRMGSSVPVNQVTGLVNLCAGPSRVALARTPRMSMGQWTLATKLYVTCHLTNQLAEIDPDSGELTATIEVGRGPVSIALNFSSENTASPAGAASSAGAIDPCADPYVSDAVAKQRGVICPAGKALRQKPRAYISTYFDNAIAVVDLDPSSPSYRRLVSRIGIPSPKKVE